MLRIIFLFCLVALTLVNAFPGHSHDQLHQLHHARRALTKGQAEKPNDITALGVQSATLSANAPSNSGVGHFFTTSISISSSIIQPQWRDAFFRK